MVVVEILYVFHVNSCGGELHEATPIYKMMKPMYVCGYVVIVIFH